MYIPSCFEQKDRQQIIAFMHQYPFGILATAENNIPWATHIPFVTEEDGEDLIIYSHISAANPQSAHFDGREALAVFREPHAYISPTLYERKENVPTWNYVAVHAYGIPELITGKEALMNLQEKMIKMLEPSYLEQWKTLPEKYVDGLMNGITGFKMRITRLHGKEKLSQNKTGAERQNISGRLLDSDNSVEKEVGKRMK